MHLIIISREYYNKLDVKFVLFKRLFYQQWASCLTSKGINLLVSIELSASIMLHGFNVKVKL